MSISAVTVVREAGCGPIKSPPLSEGGTSGCWIGTAAAPAGVNGPGRPAFPIAAPAFAGSDIATRSGRQAGFSRRALRGSVVGSNLVGGGLSILGTSNGVMSIIRRLRRRRRSNSAKNVATSASAMTATIGPTITAPTFVCRVLSVSAVDVP